MIGLFALALAAGSAVTAYDCAVPPPKMLNVQGGVASLTTIGLPGNDAAGWKFRIERSAGKDARAKVIWPADPMQIAGNWPLISTGKDAYAFAPVSAGPCLLTETACLSTVQLIDQPDGGARIMIQPTAFSSDEAAGTRLPFIVVIEGACTRAGENK